MALILFLDEAFSDQPKYLTGEKLIDVFHFSGDLSNTHGVPFKFNAKRGEAFAQTKKRLQDRIGRNNVPDDRFVKYRFALPVAEFKQPIYLTDGMLAIFESSDMNSPERL